MISYELQDGIARLAMDDGKRNVGSPSFLASFNEALDKAEADKAKAVVLAGRPGTFSAGFDLKEFQKGPDAAKAMVNTGFKLLLRLFEFKRPLIAECDGHGIGLGAFYLLVCDLRIASEGEHKFSLPESRLGMELGPFLTAIVSHRITPKYLTRAAVMSEEMGPQTAVEAGFLDKVVPAGSEREHAMAMAKALAEMPSVYGPNKKAVRAVALRDMRDFLKTMDG